jgi:peptide/nickel transport system substrate-binding protein
VLATTGVVSAAACHRSPPPAPEPRTLRIGTQATVEAVRVLSDLLYAEPLLTIGWNGRFSPRLASDYQWQDSGRTLQLSLLPNVQFHDGTPLTAAAVTKILEGKARTGGFQFVTTIETPRAGVLLIHLSRPDAFLLDALAGTLIVPAETPDIGTGPFKLLTREPAIRAERNGHYYRGIPGVEQVQITTYDSARGAWAAMMRRELDMVTEVNRESVEFLQRAARFNTYPSIRPFYIPLVFNLRHPILKNVEVRRALADAIDREEIVRRAMRTHGQVADDPLWPYNWAYTPTVRRHSFDPAAAAARLEAAGFQVRPPTEPGVMPSRFRIRCLFWTKDAQFERIALMLQRQLATIGVDLVLEPVEQEQVEERIKTGRFDTYIYQHSSGRSFETTYRFWHSDSDRAGAGYTGVDEALDRLRASNSDAEVRVAIADLRERFYEDVPAAFIARPEATRAVDTQFDVGDRSDPEVLANLWRWTIVKPEQRAAR